MQIQTAFLSDLTTRLTPISDTPALDASVLIAHIVGKPRTWVMAHLDLTLTTEQQDQLDVSLKRLERGEPLPYVIGKWEFFGLEFDLTSDVLIPRPETELLVEKAIAWLQANPQRRTLADVGTGSGAIAVSLAVNNPHVNILATDISPGALQVAKRNAQKHGVSDRVEFVQCDLFPEDPPIVHRPSSIINHQSQIVNRKSSIVNRQSSIDLICANLPYIPTSKLRSLPVFGREPTLALDGGEDGFDVIRRLLGITPQWLGRNGMILLEIEATRGAQAFNLAHNRFPNAAIHLHRDLAGNDRLLEIAL